MSCSVNLTYEVPRDQIKDLCSGYYVNTSSNCVTSRLVNSNILTGGDFSCKTFYLGWTDEFGYWNPDYYGEPSFNSDYSVNASCTYNSPTYLTASATDALIVVTEPGNIDASASNLAALKASYPVDLYPYFRTLQNNVMAAYLKRILEINGSKYGRIYLVKSDSEIKSLLLGSINRITLAHKKVDLLLAIHGNVERGNSKFKRTKKYNKLEQSS